MTCYYFSHLIKFYFNIINMTCTFKVKKKRKEKGRFDQ